MQEWYLKQHPIPQCNVATKLAQIILVTQTELIEKASVKYWYPHAIANTLKQDLRKWKSGKISLTCAIPQNYVQRWIRRSHLMKGGGWRRNWWNMRGDENKIKNHKGSVLWQESSPLWLWEHWVIESTKKNRSTLRWKLASFSNFRIRSSTTCIKEGWMLKKTTKGDNKCTHHKSCNMQIFLFMMII